MGRLFAAALVAGAISASVSTAQATTVGIDFGCATSLSGINSCNSSDAPLQDGYLGWAGPYGGNPGEDYDVTRSFTAGFGDSGTFDLTVTSDGLFFRDYAAVGGTYASQSALLSDSMLRNQPGSIVFTFSGLTAGTYSMESFHHDTYTNSSATVLFDAMVEDASGTRTVASGANNSFGTSPTSITALLYALTVGADGTATVTFSTSNAALGEHMSINGFQLTDVAPVPLPAGVWLLLSALGGLGFAGWRRKRVETG